MNNLRKRYFLKKLTLLNRVCSSNYSTSVTKSSQKITIPTRIEREPTDILRALSNTVQYDPTAAHFKYHDDPYLVPTSNVGKRTFAMAQEAGRKAAHWIKQEHAVLFNHNAADPEIKVFMPRIIYNENSEVNLDILKSVINEGEVTDSILIYQLLNQKSIEIPNDVKLDLLQLICFFNHEDTLNDDLTEERWFRQSTTIKERQRKTWKDGDLAEQIFNEIENKDEKSYSTIIRGMAKYYQVEKAWSLFQEATDKAIPLDVTTYNSIMQVVNFIKESSELRWSLIKELLTLMSEKKLKPNVETMNSILSAISMMGINKLARNYALKTLSEFKEIGVTPSLATWYYILTIFCRERGPTSHVLIDILNEIEGKEFKIQDTKDTFFFVTAMDVCRHHLHDKVLAKRVDKLLHFGSNYDLIGDSFKESVYYRHLFALLCQTESFDVFMEELYNNLVPNIYIPEPGVMEEVIKAIDTNGALSYIPRIWSDMVIFDHTHRESLLRRVLKIMIENYSKPSVPGEENLNEKFSEIGWNIWKILHEQPETRTQKLTIHGDMLGEILELCTRIQNIERANEIFEYLDKKQQTIVGVPNPTYLGNFIKLCINENEPNKAISCLQYCMENSFVESEIYGKLISSSMTLNDNLQLKLKKIIEK